MKDERKASYRKMDMHLHLSVLDPPWSVTTKVSVQEVQLLPSPKPTCLQSAEGPDEGVSTVGFSSDVSRT